MIARRLKTYLDAIPALRARLSAPKWGMRTRVGTIPQGMPLPYVRLVEISANPEYHLGGELGDLDAVVQVDVWAESEKEADEIAELIRLAPLSGYRGTWTETDGATTEVKAVTIQSEQGTYEVPGDGSDAMRYRNTRDYKIHFERPVN